MAGQSLKERAFWTIHSDNTKSKDEMIHSLIHHIEMLDKKIEQLKRKNERLERKYWEIKLNT